MHAATQLVAREGVRGARLAEVAQAAGVAVGTVYRYYPSKDHLLAAVRAQVEREFVAAMERSAPEDSPLLPALPAMTAAVLVTAAQEYSRVLVDVPAPAGAPDADSDGALIRAWIARRVSVAHARGEITAADPELLADLGYALVAAGVRQAVQRGLDTRELEAVLVAGLEGMLRPAR